jgi:hypothetical protein
MPRSPEEIRRLLRLIEDFKNSSHFDQYIARDMPLLVARARLKQISIDAIKANMKTEGNSRIIRRIVGGPF